jgi:hypothetical protein
MSKPFLRLKGLSRTSLLFSLSPFDWILERNDYIREMPSLNARNTLVLLR